MTNSRVIKVIGEGEYGPVTITVNGETITVRINPGNERRRFRCSACGVQSSVNGCEHLRLAAVARVLADGTQPPPPPTPPQPRQRQRRRKAELIHRTQTATQE